MSSMVDVKTLYENLLNLNLSEGRDASAGSEPLGGGGDSHVWPLRTVWSPSTEQTRSLPEPAAPRPSFRTDRSLSLIEGRALPPPPPGFPPLQPPPSPALSARYKTELCRTYSETGRCRYGTKCQFAHGAGELRSLSRHPKYKTELCHKFYLHGECPYGSRCHFVHYPEERGLAASPQLLRQSLSYTGVPAARQGSPPPGISDPASFTRAPSISPPPASDLLSPPFARLNSEPVPRMATLGEALASSAPSGRCTCRCGGNGRLGTFESPRDYYAAAPGMPVASGLPRTPSSNSLSDQDCYSSSGSLSGSESPVFEMLPTSGTWSGTRRLPIFNRISVSESGEVLE
ncbi:mRNA decay activator protein ZFP36 [Mauremys reevesii]|uniref:mRNA decay activator protein ZFP36 n=1 Tax=Mauremys reevesii TaxID=260615 RepID=UPI00193FAC02|nr:mRNA decay activator protein ZFP36 [Mauremys reevesii]